MRSLFGKQTFAQLRTGFTPAQIKPPASVDQLHGDKDRLPIQWHNPVTAESGETVPESEHSSLPESEPSSLEEGCLKVSLRVWRKGCRNARLRVWRKGAGKRALEREAVAHPEHRFPAPSSKLCQNLVTPLKGRFLSPRSCPPTLSAPTDRSGY